MYSANAEPSCIVNEIQEFAKVSDKDILISWVSTSVSWLEKTCL